MNKLTKFYYHMTAYVPRRLPRTEQEYEKFRTVLMDAYGCPDEPATWATVGGQITSTLSVQVRRPWGHIANVAKRLKINELAHSQQQKAVKAFNDRLAVLMAAESERIKNEQATTEVVSETHAVTEPQASEAHEVIPGSSEAASLPA